MKRNRFSEEQIIGILKEHEAGVLRCEPERLHLVEEPPQARMVAGPICFLATQ
jgi:hypothetical protein